MTHDHFSSASERSQRAPRNHHQTEPNLKCSKFCIDISVLNHFCIATAVFKVRNTVPRSRQNIPTCIGYQPPNSQTSLHHAIMSEVTGPSLREGRIRFTGVSRVYVNFQVSVTVSMSENSTLLEKDRKSTKTSQKCSKTPKENFLAEFLLANAWK